MREANQSAEGIIMGIMNHTYNIRFLREEEFEDIVELGAKVHGENYMSVEELHNVLEKSKLGGSNCSFTMALNKGDGVECLIGFRLTYAPGNWLDSFDCQISPELWGFDPDKVAYLKSNTLDAEFRGSGFGRMLLDRSIAECKRMGAEAAVTHIWMNSPGNSAYNYFSRAGGRDIKTYPSYWHDDFENFGYVCSHCGEDCHCPGTEMILDFSTHKELGDV